MAATAHSRGSQSGLTRRHRPPGTWRTVSSPARPRGPRTQARPPHNSLWSAQTHTGSDYFWALHDPNSSPFPMSWHSSLADLSLLSTLGGELKSSQFFLHPLQCESDCELFFSWLKSCRQFWMRKYVAKYFYRQLAISGPQFRLEVRSLTTL